MSLPPLATDTDIATRLQRALTDAEKASAVPALGAASDVIRGETRQDFTAATDDTVTLAVTELGEWLDLPQHPVSDVTSVSIDDQIITDFRIVPGKRCTRLYRIGGWYVGTLNTIIGSTGNRDLTAADSPTFIDVVYSHGYDPLPGDVIAVAVNIALPQIVNPRGLPTETVGPFMYRDDAGQTQSAAALLTVEDLKRRYLNRKPLRSVQLTRTWDR